MSDTDPRLASALADSAGMANGIGGLMSFNALAMAAKGISVSDIAKFLRCVDLAACGVRAEALMFILLRDFDCIEAGHALQKAHELQMYMLKFFERIGAVNVGPEHKETVVEQSIKIRKSMDIVDRLVNALELKAATAVTEALKQSGAKP